MIKQSIITINLKEENPAQMKNLQTTEANRTQPEDMAWPF